MNQPIAGVSPAGVREMTVMTVWPTLAAMPGGLALGRAYNWQAFRGILPFGMTGGSILALLSIPLVLPAIILQLLPGSPFCRRYRLTNRRVAVEDGVTGREERSVSLDRFDSIDIEVLPGHEWYPAGDLVFRQGNVETFRLPGVRRPEAFRLACLRARQAVLGVRQARPVAGSA